MCEYKVENFENEDHIIESDFFENPIIIKINEWAKEGWEVQQIIPWEVKGYKEYMILFKRKRKEKSK